MNTGIPGAFPAGGMNPLGGVNPVVEIPGVPLQLEAIAAAAEAASKAKRKRMCRFPGCKSVIKSHGHCQKHGAKSKKCKVVGCDKQSQGGQFEGMCKRHFKQNNPPKEDEAAAAASAAAKEAAAQNEAAATEQYDALKPVAEILSESMQWFPRGSKSIKKGHPLIAFLHENDQIQPKGWLRLSEARKSSRPIPQLSQQLVSEEVTMLSMIKMCCSGLMESRRLDKILGHAFGKSEAGIRGTITRYLGGGSYVASRKTRKNKDQTVFDNEQSRKQVYTARNYFKKVRHRQEKNVSEEILKVEWDALNDTDRQYFESQANHQLEESRKLHDRLKEAYKKKGEEFTGNGFARDMSTQDPRTGLYIPLISSQRTHDYLSTLRENGEL